MSIALFPVFSFFLHAPLLIRGFIKYSNGGMGGGGGVTGGSPRFPYFDVFHYVNCGEGYGIRSTRVPRFYNRVFNPVIPMQIFARSRKPDGYFRHPAPGSFFQSRSALPFATGFLNKTIPDPDKSLAEDPQHRSPGSSHEKFDVSRMPYLEADIRQRGRECFLSISEYWAVTNFSNVATYT